MQETSFLSTDFTLLQKHEYCQLLYCKKQHGICATKFKINGCLLSKPLISLLFPFLPSQKSKGKKKNVQSETSFHIEMLQDKSLAHNGNK